MYAIHPSAELSAMFRHRPFQGVVPEQAAYVFVGLDASYAPDIGSTDAFADILDYHADGVAFWRRHGVHHPFLLPRYRGDGRRYHLNFARIGFSPSDAERISFIELLHVPTVGRNQLSPGDFDPEHLDRINRLITSGAQRRVFVSDGVLRLMHATRRFPWMPREVPRTGDLPEVYRDRGTVVHRHLHFSNYGKFQAQLEREARAIGALRLT